MSDLHAIGAEELRDCGHVKLYMIDALVAPVLIGRCLFCDVVAKDAVADVIELCERVATAQRHGEADPTPCPQCHATGAHKRGCELL